MNNGQHSRFLNNRANKTWGKNENSALLFSGIVRDVCVNEKSPMFEENNGYSSIGMIKFDTISQGVGGTNEGLIAMPLNPNVVQTPLPGEIVVIINGQSVNPRSVNTPMDAFYYLSSTNLFNNKTYNPFTPTFMNYDVASDTPKNRESQALSPRINRGGESSAESRAEGIDSSPRGQRFVDKGDVRPTKNYTGDVIYEGRYGNSIRLSSTGANMDNSWSQTKDSNKYGDPIMILHNGSPKLSRKVDSFIPYSENPTEDRSSIYLSSTQRLPIINPPSTYNASTNPPIALSEFNKPQILVNSDRIVLSAKNDAAIIQAATSVNLSSNSVGVDAKEEFVVDSPEIKLGNNAANESIMLGDKTNRLLIQALTSIKDLAVSLQDLQNWPGGAAVPNQDVIMQAVTTENMVDQVLDNLKGRDNLSKVSKSI